MPFPSLKSPTLASSLLIVSLLTASGSQARAADKYVSVAEARLTADVSFLADDAREGRGPGTDGLIAAGDYIADHFRAAGLKPVPGAQGYFQYFTIPGEARVAGEPSIVLHAPSEFSRELESKDFTPLAIGGSATLKAAPIVFAGYGITVADGESYKYDDYAGIDVKDKIVLILRREPQQKQEDSPFGGTGSTGYATFRHKARNALSHDAAGVILVNDAAGLGEDPDSLMPFNSTGGSGQGIPFIMMRREVADELLAKAGAPSLAELEASIDRDLKPVSRALEGATLDAELVVSRDPIKVRNVIGMVEGAGPLAEETIVVGAHYDHLGYGGSGSLAFSSTEIHNGADDNASGTSLMMELARRIASRPDPLPRRVVFMAFSAEERGLLGSRYYVENPLIPLDQTVAMINFDMVGRLEDDRELSIYGANSSTGFKELVASLATSQDIEPKVINEGPEMRYFQASDHASFYAKDIPVLFAFTGTHAEYHKPSDDTPLVDFNGMARIANFGELVLLDLALRPVRPAFSKVEQTTGSRPAAAAASATSDGPEGAMPYLGTRPSYGETEIQGVKLDGVAEGSPAEKGGLKGGDVIVKFAGQAVLDLEDYMEGLTKHKAGDTVEIVVKRGDKEETLSIKLGTRSSQ